MSGLGTHDPNKTLPVGSRVYPVPSCGACLRIAHRHGVAIGQSLFVDGERGTVEGVSHADGAPFVIVALENGFIVSAPARRYYADADLVSDFEMVSA